MEFLLFAQFFRDRDNLTSLLKKKKEKKKKETFYQNQRNGDLKDKYFSSERYYFFLMLEKYKTCNQMVHCHNSLFFCLVIKHEQWEQS